VAYFGHTGILKSGESWIYLAVWRTRLAVRFAIINSWSGRRTFVCPSHAIFRRFLQVRTAKHEIHAPITRRRPFFSFSPLDLQLLAIYLCILCWWTLREIVLRIVQSIGSRVYML